MRFKKGTWSICTLTLLCALLTGCASTQVGAQRTGKGREIMASNISFDLKSGEIRYTLPEPALVRMRIRIPNGGPMVRNLMDWERREAGEHVEVWDKKDENGVVTFGNNGEFMVFLACIPVNEKEWPWDSKIVNGFRKSPKFTVSFLHAKQQEDGVPTLKGQAPVRVTVDTKDRQWLIETKYEVAIYIDHTFLMEDEEGTNPFTYQLDTQRLNNGPHTITVNIATFQGEAATQTAKVIVNNG